MPMHLDPRAVFEAVVPRLPEALVPRARVALCRKVAESLPRATSSYYLECRLDQDEQVDFLVLTRHPDAAELFKASLGHVARRSSWQRTLDLFEDRRLGRAGLDRVQLFWLEYDIDATFCAEGPLASPGFCLEKDYPRRPRLSPPVGQELTKELAHAGLSRLLGTTDCERSARILRLCVDALPAGGSLIHVSAMLTRDPVRTKLYVAVPKGQLLQYLNDIAWPGPKERVERLMSDSYHRVPDTAFIDLSIGDGLDSSIGLALSQLHETEMAEFDPSWSWLPMEGTCGAKRAAVVGWTGITEMELEGRRYWVHRWLDVKLVLDAAGECRHKAYLGFMAARPPPFA